MASHLTESTVTVAAPAARTASCTYSVDTYHGLIDVRLSNRLDLGALADTARLIESDPLYSRSFDVVIDCRGLQTIPDSDAIYALAGAWLRLPVDGRMRRWAIVANPWVGYAASRVFELATGVSGACVRAFQSNEEAAEWLGRASTPDAAD